MTRPCVTIDPALTHECSKCGVVFPRTAEYFYTRGRGSNTLLNNCKRCQSDVDKQNKAKLRAQRTADGKYPSAQHSFRDGIEGKVCGEGRRQHRSTAINCYAWLPLSAFAGNSSYADGLGGTCKACKRKQRKPTPSAKSQTVLALARPQILTIHGIDVTVGWAGDVGYWPVKPLAHLTKMDWRHLHPAIKDDSLFSSVVTDSVTTGASDGKRYKMLCLPWSHWHSFWLKFGNADTLDVQRDAQRVLAAVFGTTADQVRESTQRQRTTPLISLDVDAVEKHRAKIEHLFASKDEVDAARQAAVADREQAQLLIEEAERFAQEAHERKQTARRLEQAAQSRIDAAEKRRQSITDELARVLGAGVEYWYDFGRPEELTPMYASGKFGMTWNVAAKRKSLKAPSTKGDFRRVKPCDSGESCEMQTRRYLGAFGTIRGNDGYDNVPRFRYDRLIAAIDEREYLEADWLRRWVDKELTIARSDAA